MSVYEDELADPYPERDDNDPPPDPCVLCGTSPQSIGLHCSNCWNDLSDIEQSLIEMDGRAMARYRGTEA